MARSSNTVEGLVWEREESASARWAFVGGLKEESRIYISLSFGRLDDRLRI